MGGAEWVQNGQSLKAAAMLTPCATETHGKCLSARWVDFRRFWRIPNLRLNLKTRKDGPFLIIPVPLSRWKCKEKHPQAEKFPVCDKIKRELIDILRPYWRFMEGRSINMQLNNIHTYIQLHPAVPTNSDGAVILAICSCRRHGRLCGYPRHGITEPPRSCSVTDAGLRSPERMGDAGHSSWARQIQLPSCCWFPHLFLHPISVHVEICQHIEKLINWGKGKELSTVDFIFFL